MKYEERLQHYQKRYALYNLPSPKKELVENDQFCCPCCGKIRELNTAKIEVKEGKTLSRDFDFHGRIIAERKTIDRVCFYICDKCKKDNDALDEDPILLWTMIVLAVVFFIGDFAYCIYNGIHNGNFSFIINCVVNPFLIGIVLCVVLCLIMMIVRFLLSIFKYKKAKTLNLSMTSSMDSLASGNALV